MKQKSFLLKNSFIVVLLIVIGFLIYANSLPNKMFWDDNDGIINNQFVHNWRYFPKYFSENLIAGSGLLSNYWRPMLLTVFSLEWHTWKNWAPGYHFINMSFHITDAILLFLILLYLFKNRWLAILTSLIFLVHPLQTEAVTYVSGLGDSLSAFFIFIGILFYLKFRISEKPPLKSVFYFSSLLMYVFSLMSKETAIVMPAYLFIVDFYFLFKNKRYPLRKALKDIGKTIWPFFVLAGLYIWLRATVLNFENSFNLYNEKNAFTSNFHIRLFTFFRVLTIYFSLLFWPLNLHMERTVNIAFSLNSFSVIFGAFLSLTLIVFAFTKFKKFPIISFSIIWFFIGLAPVSNIFIPISGLIYEHWLYLPLIGIFLPLLSLILITGKKYRLQKTLLVSLILLLIFFSFLTIKRNRDWRNPIIFYNQTLKYAPNSYRIINNLGMAYADEKDYRNAERMYKRAIKLDRKNPVAYHNIANLYRNKGKTDLAIKNYKIAIALNKKFFFSYNMLADLYLKNKEYEKAREVLDEYIKNNGPNINIFIILSKISMLEKKPKIALSYLEKALKIEPNNQFIKISIANIKNLTNTEK